MGAGLKKLVGSLGLLGGLIVYIVLALIIGARLPHVTFIELPYYLVAGLLWVWPAKIIILWMHK
jgi:prolipoprotein diacylglyceryltransferase